MLHFYFIFWATPTYVPFVPIGGVDSDLFFDVPASNQALIDLRRPENKTRCDMSHGKRAPGPFRWTPWEAW